MLKYCINTNFPSLFLSILEIIHFLCLWHSDIRIHFFVEPSVHLSLLSLKTCIIFFTSSYNKRYILKHSFYDIEIKCKKCIKKFKIFFLISPIILKCCIVNIFFIFESSVSLLLPVFQEMFKLLILYTYATTIFENASLFHLRDVCLF